MLVTTVAIFDHSNFKCSVLQSSSSLRGWRSLLLPRQVVTITSTDIPASRRTTVTPASSEIYLASMIRNMLLSQRPCAIIKIRISGDFQTFSTDRQPVLITAVQHNRLRRLTAGAHNSVAVRFHPSHIVEPKLYLPLNLYLHPPLHTRR